jgi:hypothetical protein
MSEVQTAPRATTIFGEQGDVTIVWTEDEDDAMEEIIAAKMAEGTVFFIIEPRFFGLLPAKKTELKDATEARKHRALAVKDGKFSDFVMSGRGDVVKTPDAPVAKTRRAKSAKEAASTQTIGVRPLVGG